MKNKYLPSIDNSLFSNHSLEKLIELIKNSELELLEEIKSKLKLDIPN